MSYHGYKSIVFRKKFQNAILMKGVQGFWGGQILDFFLYLGINFENLYLGINFYTLGV